jgi:acetyl-CoA decarbonylase/synthase complex subunit gamma
MGWIEAGGRRVPRISTTLLFGDRLGAWKARWGIGRMKYLVPAGLYALGNPGPEDPVVVTANYKMTYDFVRRELARRDAWLLVLETFGINVWCAAGKGTFGTEELVRRVEASGLARVVSHRRLLLPILGAPGVAAHAIRQQTGFAVTYAAVRAADLPDYLDNGRVTTPSMRELTFTFRERLALVPVELVGALKPTLVLSAVLFGLAAALGGWAPAAGLKAAAAFWGAVVAGTVITPLLLPWLPGRSFAVKGALVGLAWSGLCYALGSGAGALPAAALFLALPAVSAFYAFNFTGSTPFTSRSGVKREMRLAMPALLAAFGCGSLLWLAGSLL